MRRNHFRLAVLAALVLAAIALPVFAQEGGLTIAARRNWGFSQGGQIQGKAK